MRTSCWAPAAPIAWFSLVFLFFAAPPSWAAAQGQQRAPAASPRPASSVGNGHAWRLKKVSQDGDIGYDALPQWGIPATPKKHITIVSMLIPYDWTFKSAQDHPQKQDCSLTSGRLILLAASPDGKSLFLSKPVPDTVSTNNRMALSGIQGDNQQFAQMLHCIVEPTRSLAERQNELAQALIPSMQVAGELEPIPELSGKLPQMLSQANAELQREAATTGAPPQRVNAEAARFRVTLQDTKTGEQSEGYVYAMQVVRTTQLPGGGILNLSSVPMLFLAGTPVGQFKTMEPVFAAMAGSIDINPEYQAECLQISANITRIHQLTKQRLAQIQSQMAADNARTAANIANIQAGVAQYRNQVINNVAANRSAALEHSSQQFALYMGDQAQYRDPSSGQSVILPSGANHVWASQTGNTNEYILTDSASYNPNGQVGSSGWSELQLQH